MNKMMVLFLMFHESRIQRCRAEGDSLWLFTLRRGWWWPGPAIDDNDKPTGATIAWSDFIASNPWEFRRKMADVISEEKRVKLNLKGL